MAWPLVEYFLSILCFSIQQSEKSGQLMAGAAGFEPTVPGLGGRCIIQTMLHARFWEHTPLKKGRVAKLCFFL